MVIYDRTQYGFIGFSIQGYLGAMHEITHPKTVYMIGFKTGPHIPALAPEIQ